MMSMLNREKQAKQLEESWENDARWNGIERLIHG